jgi:Fe2+ or Zn2+ uptake regulation protein
MADESPDDLPTELRAFLHSCIESIAQVEILMLLRGSERSRSAREVASALRVPSATARRDLDTLSARGLLSVHVAEETGYRYHPKSEELARYCDLLAEHYVTSRQAVFGFVATESRLSIKRFADAFRLRDREK